MRRFLCLLGGLLAGVAAHAQGSPASPSDDLRQFDAAREADFNQWRWMAERRGRQHSEAEAAVQAVADALAQRDCAKVVAALNAGLAKRLPDVWVLAGALYEDGLCLKPNFERAVSFYERAVAVNHAGAAARLAAGFATPAGGRDAAASLWWSLRARTPLPAACAQVASLSDDPERFVAALKGWPPGQLGACVYAGAVLATVQGEVEQPLYAAAYGLEGRVVVRFAPAAGALELSPELEAPAQAAGVVGDPGARERDMRAARAAVAADLKRLAERALKRFERPAGVPEAWRVEGALTVRAPR